MKILHDSHPAHPHKPEAIATDHSAVSSCCTTSPSRNLLTLLLFTFLAACEPTGGAATLQVKSSDVLHASGSGGFRIVSPNVTQSLSIGDRVQTSVDGRGLLNFGCALAEIFGGSNLQVQNVSLNAVTLNTNGSQLFSSKCSTVRVSVGNPQQAVIETRGTVFLAAYDASQHTAYVWTQAGAATLTNWVDGQPAASVAISAGEWSVVRDAAAPEPPRPVSEMGAIIDELSLRPVYDEVVQTIQTTGFGPSAPSPIAIAQIETPTVIVPTVPPSSTLELLPTVERPTLAPPPTLEPFTIAAPTLSLPTTSPSAIGHFGAVIFGGVIGPDNHLYDIRKSFPDGVTAVDGTFLYENVAPGQPFRVQVFIDGKSAPQYGLEKKWDRPENGEHFLRFLSPDGLPTGVWDVHLYLQEELLASNDFVIEPNPPGEPDFGPITLALDQDFNGNASNPLPLDAPFVPKDREFVYAYFNGIGIPQGTQWSRQLFLNDKPFSEPISSTWDEGPDASFHILLALDSPAQPGAYELRLFIESREVNVASFIVQP